MAEISILKEIKNAHAFKIKADCARNKARIRQAELWLELA